MTIAPLVFVDVETTGTGPVDEVWEIAAVRREPDGIERSFHALVHHDYRKLACLPREYRINWATYFDPAKAVSPGRAADDLIDFLAPHPQSSYEHPLPVWLGVNPGFDVRYLQRLIDVHSEDDVELLGGLCHYRPVAVDALAAGWLAPTDGTGFELPWSSEDISRGLNVDPAQFDRHTAMGDVRWAMAMFDAVQRLKRFI